MASKRSCEYFIVEYVPNVIRADSENIGVIVLEKPPQSDEATADSHPFVGVRFRKDWTCLNRFGTDVDVEVVVAIVKEITTEISTASSEPGRITQLLQELGLASNGVVLGPARGLLSDDPEKSLVELAARYLSDDSSSLPPRSDRRQRPVAG
jgi:DUF3037 family protein